ncbi:multidrug effflux MFS transporter [Pedobacter sp. B4-66]|uniref:multidrug effflux MFS transporter n=1 Tax=Pedobacter sp. B4-66 TaxID=2817280 RepID=UPI001BDA8C38|nr:multidrug effflux MFS transporter [Pedobacter sp. B4-66]
MKINAKPLLITLTLGILTAIGSISIDIYLPAFGIMANYFKVPIVRVESTVTLFLFGMSFGQLLIGPLSDVWGRKTPLRIGLTVYVLCSICCILTNSFSLFLALRFIQGLAGSACQVICRALVSDIYKDKNAAHVFTILQIIMGISPILSPIAGGMLAEESTWKYLFLIMAVVSGLGLVGCLTVLPAGKAASDNKRLNVSGILNSYSYCLKHPAFINYALVRAISNSAAFSFITASPFIFTQIYGLSKKQFGFVFSALAIGIISTGILNTKLLKHFEVQKITKLAITCQLVTGLMLIITLYFNGSFPVLLGLIFIFLSMLGLILPNTTSLYIGSIPSFSGSASALVGALSYLSAFLITSVLSLLYNSTAYPMILMMCFCAVLAHLCLKHKNRSGSYNEI